MSVGERAVDKKMSHFSASCLNFRLDVPTFFQTSHFSSRCLIFQPVVSFFVQLSQFSSGCLNFRLFRLLDFQLDFKHW
ncbi:hypothetical protein V9T40_005192 [Parthenolecanium corni]|uniref:Uncharacterized protein n=1 Tax=Parthenolecanium corni TaxID=536013 RepID=A0AAN9TFH9_9HEMI